MSAPTSVLVICAIVLLNWYPITEKTRAEVTSCSAILPPPPPPPLFTFFIFIFVFMDSFSVVHTADFGLFRRGRRSTGGAPRQPQIARNDTSKNVTSVPLLQKYLIMIH